MVLKVWARIWGTLYEPRVVTAMMVTAYTIAGIIGLTITTSHTPAPHPYEAYTNALLILLLVGGAAVGVPTAWVGAWWMERGAALAVAGGLGMLAIEVAATWESGTAWVTVCALALAILFMLTRYVRVCQVPYAPGKGPLPMAQKMGVREIVLDTRERGSE